jgi:hypothetical protein
VQKINLDNVTITDNIWDLADEAFVQPAFRG